MDNTYVRIKQIQIASEIVTRTGGQDVICSDFICAICQTTHDNNKRNPVQRNFFKEIRPTCLLECDYNWGHSDSYLAARYIYDNGWSDVVCLEDKQFYPCVSILIHELYKTKKILSDMYYCLLKDNLLYTSKIPNDILCLIRDYLRT
jgi:hypothetical protein